MVILTLFETSLNCRETVENKEALKVYILTLFETIIKMQ